MPSKAELKAVEENIFGKSRVQKSKVEIIQKRDVVSRGRFNEMLNQYEETYKSMQTEINDCLTKLQELTHKGASHYEHIVPSIARDYAELEYRVNDLVSNFNQTWGSIDTGCFEEFLNSRFKVL